MHHDGLINRCGHGCYPEKAKQHLKAAQSRASSHVMVGPSIISADSGIRIERGRDAAAELTALRSTRFCSGAIQNWDVPEGSLGVITLFSVAKWIHLHVGDEGMKQVLPLPPSALGVFVCHHRLHRLVLTSCFWGCVWDASLVANARHNQMHGPVYWHSGAVPDVFALCAPRSGESPSGRHIPPR